MEYLNVKLAMLRNGEVLTASNAVVGLWLRLTAYCWAQENGGRIEGAEAWSDRTWLLAGMDWEGVEKESPLWSWEDGDLVVHHFPIEWLERWQACRKGGSRSSEAKKRAAAAREARKRAATTSEPQPNHNQTTSESTSKAQAKPQAKHNNVSKVSNVSKVKKNPKSLKFSASAVFAEALGEDVEVSARMLLETAYSEWVDYRRDLRKPVKAPGAKIDGKRCRDLVAERNIPPGVVAEWLRTAISQGWQGWYFAEQVDRAANRRGEDEPPRKFGGGAVVDFNPFSR